MIKPFEPGKTRIYGYYAHKTKRGFTPLVNHVEGVIVDGYYNEKRKHWVCLVRIKSETKEKAFNKLILTKQQL